MSSLEDEIFDSADKKCRVTGAARNGGVFLDTESDVAACLSIYEHSEA